MDTNRANVVSLFEEESVLYPLLLREPLLSADVLCEEMKAPAYLAANVSRQARMQNAH
jgi:hypothetical protein